MSADEGDQFAPESGFPNQAESFAADINRAAATPDGYKDAASIYLLIGETDAAEPIGNSLRVRALDVLMQRRGIDNEWKARAEHIREVAAHPSFAATLLAWVEKSELSEPALQKLRLLVVNEVRLSGEIREAAIHAALRHPDLIYQSRINIAEWLATQRPHSGLTAEEIEFFLDWFVRHINTAGDTAGTFGFYLKWHKRLVKLKKPVNMPK